MPATSRERRPSRLRGLLTMGFYQPIFLLAFLLYSPVLVWRMATDPRYRKGLRERMGYVPRRVGDGPAVWIHGVSVGEVKAASNIVAELRRERCDLEVVVSSTTPTGHHVARSEHPDLRVVFYPLDFGRFPGRALDRIRPCCVLLMELEIWPNFLRAAARRDVPVGVINGRISERSFRGYRLARGLLPQLDLIRLFCVQDEAYARRLRDLGVSPDRIHVTGNMKYDSVTMADPTADAARLRPWLAEAKQLVLVAGSTHGDEDRQVALAAGKASAATGVGLRVVVAPRHPERAPAVCDALSHAGLRPRRWSATNDGREPLEPDAVLVVDTIGVLQTFYGACDIAFVGGSLVPHGGQNMLEPAALGKPVIFGPHVQNFRTDVELLLAAKAVIQVAGARGFRERLEELLGDAERRASLGRRALEVIRANQGATRRTLELLRPLLGASPSRRPGPSAQERQQEQEAKG